MDAAHIDGRGLAVFWDFAGQGRHLAAGLKTQAAKLGGVGVGAVDTVMDEQPDGHRVIKAPAIILRLEIAGEVHHAPCLAATKARR